MFDLPRFLGGGSRIHKYASFGKDCEPRAPAANDARAASNDSCRRQDASKSAHELVLVDDPEEFKILVAKSPCRESICNAQHSGLNYDNVELDL